MPRSIRTRARSAPMLSAPSYPYHIPRDSPCSRSIGPCDARSGSSLSHASDAFLKMSTDVLAGELNDRSCSHAARRGAAGSGELGDPLAGRGAPVPRARGGANIADRPPDRLPVDRPAANLCQVWAALAVLWPAPGRAGHERGAGVATTVSYVALGLPSTLPGGHPPIRDLL